MRWNNSLLGRYVIGEVVRPGSTGDWCWGGGVIRGFGLGGEGGVAEASVVVFVGFRCLFLC